MDSTPCSSQTSVRPPGFPKGMLYSRTSQRSCLQRHRVSALGPLTGNHMVGVWQPYCLGSAKGVKRSRRETTVGSIDPEGPSGNWLENVKEEQKLESTRFKSEVRESVMSAVKELGNRVTTGDVAGRAGVSLNEAEEVLKALAMDSSGHLEVSNDGEVVYILPSDFRNKIFARSVVMRWEPALKKFREVAGSIGRAAFGLGFVATVISVWVAVLAINSSGGNREDSRSPRSSGMYMAFNILDAYRWWWYFSRPSPPQTPGELGFMEAVYSCMFGDGDPNKTFEEKRWNVIGRYIQSKGGVVVGEELAPFLNPPKSDGMDDASSSMFPDEGFMLPVLTRFGGEPQVSEQGDLLYIFPRFQQSASKASTSGPPQPYIQESNWKLTAAKKNQQLLVALLAAFNIVGVYALKHAVATIPELAPAAPGLVALQLYAWSFIAVPLTRFFVNAKRNKEISERNEARQQAAILAKYPTEDLERKVRSARRLSDRQVLTDRDIMFSSKNSASEFEGEDFDRKLNGLGNSVSVDM